MRDYIPKIISGVLALALLGVGAWLLVAGQPETGGSLIAAAVALVGALGTLLGTPIHADKPAGDVQKKRAKRIAQSMGDPPSDGALALALCVIAAVGSALMSGCSPTELQVHVQVAGGFEDSARETARVVRAYRTEHMRAAALTVHDAGGTEADAIAAMRAAGAELTPLVEAQREYALAVHGYTDALYLAEHTSSGGGLDLASAIPALRDVLDAYRQLRELGAALHIDALSALPAVPQWIDGVLPPQMLASSSSSPGASSAPQTSGGVQ